MLQKKQSPLLIIFLLCFYAFALKRFDVRLNNFFIRALPFLVLTLKLPVIVVVGNTQDSLQSADTESAVRSKEMLPINSNFLEILPILILGRIGIRRKTLCVFRCEKNGTAVIHMLTKTVHLMNTNARGFKLVPMFPESIKKSAFRRFHLFFAPRF
ncbi:hypothetical protein [uncultured Parasutterella sp.]|uniref:hypothetical protein n=1 Tax=uncultured Parasutterella sp. TaxID=1263098 RepID=UPI00272C5A52|nr:hypothetical protein [uncultured Parasutterella sp.]